MECSPPQSGDGVAAFHGGASNFVNLFLPRSARAVFAPRPLGAAEAAPVARASPDSHLPSLYFLFPRFLNGIDGIDVLWVVPLGLCAHDG